MEKITWKPGTMLYPLPAIMVSCGSEKPEYNIITIAWTGIICSDPPMTYISVRKERYSHHILKKNMAFVMNLTNEALANATDFCGVKSGREVDKFKFLKLTPIPATKIPAPMIQEAPVNIECKVKKIIELGSHDMFMAEVIAVHVDKSLMDEKGKFHLDESLPICYSHGEYYGLKKSLGSFGYSVKKKNNRKKLSEKSLRRKG